MATAAARRRRRASGSEDLRPHALARDIVEAFGAHDLLTYSAAVAFQILAALIPLALLTLGLLGALGLRDVWHDAMAPPIQSRVSRPVFDALDHSVRSILASGSPALIAFAALLSLWYLTRAMRAVMEALNRIHDVEETRSLGKRTLVAVSLAALSGGCAVGAALVVAAAPRLGGAPEVLLGLGRWIVVGVVLLLLVGVLVRVAPAEHPQPRWASVGSVGIVGGWLVGSILFRLWIDHVADLRSAAGTLTALLVVSGYLFMASAVFLVGTQLDELLRRKTHGRARGALALLRELRR